MPDIPATLPFLFTLSGFGDLDRFAVVFISIVLILTLILAGRVGAVLAQPSKPSAFCLRILVGAPVGGIRVWHTTHL